jgi:hypothetical protein
MKFNSTYLLIVIIVLWTCAKEQTSSKKNEDITVYDINKTECKAGEEVTFNFDATDSTSSLYYSSSYGNSVISPLSKGNRLLFTFPGFITNKVGVINWKLIQGGKTTEQGLLNVLFSDRVDKIETYFGPTFLYAGPKNFSHLVSIPIDSLDNPIKKNTEVIINEQFKTFVNSSSVYTNHLIAFKNIYSKRSTGRFLLNSECKGISSQELAATISSALPINFSININNSHPYSDGNQIASISSSVIKDKYRNIINDGTLVKFIIKNKEGNLLHTTANTVNGIATAQMIHPTQSDNWEVQAFIMGMAESNIIKANFKQSIKGYQVLFSDNNRTINIGPIKGFMEQLVPDGVTIQLSVFRDGKLIKKLHNESHQGFGHFSLTNSSFKSGNYTLEFEIAGIKKRFNDMTI